jgi:hypothetical protein
MEYGLSKRQSSHICNNCRQRKVRCDGRKEVCESCERLGLVCSYDNGHGTRQTHQRLRVKQACRQCRDARARCTGDFNGCERCRARGSNCSYSSTSPARSRKAARTTTSTRHLEGTGSPAQSTDSHSPDLQASSSRACTAEQVGTTGRE